MIRYTRLNHHKYCRILFYVVALACFTSCAIPDQSLPPESNVSLFPYIELLREYTVRKERVSRVVDGDTIKLRNGETVRYLDIDTPETVHPTKPVECYGPDSDDHNNKLVNGKVVYLYVGANAKDKYGRTLAYVFTNNSFVNGELVSEGFATVRSYGQPGELFENLMEFQKKARLLDKGLWGKCE